MPAPTGFRPVSASQCVNSVFISRPMASGATAMTTFFGDKPRDATKANANPNSTMTANWRIRTVSTATSSPATSHPDRSRSKPLAISTIDTATAAKNGTSVMNVFDCEK